MQEWRIRWRQRLDLTQIIVPHLPEFQFVFKSFTKFRAETWKKGNFECLKKRNRILWITIQVYNELQS